MRLPVMPPVAPMLAKLVEDIPTGAFSYEPKWDGFRSIVFRDGDEVEIGSRNERPMTRYSPRSWRRSRPTSRSGCVVDGEIVRPRSLGPAPGVRDAASYGSTRPRVGSRCWPRPRPPTSWPSTCSHCVIGTSCVSRSGSGAGARGGPDRRPLADPPHAGHEGSRRAERWFDEFEGAGSTA